MRFHAGLCGQYRACSWILLFPFSIYEKLIQFCAIDELGTNYPKVCPEHGLESGGAHCSVCDCVPQKVHGEVLLVGWQMPVAGLVSGSQPVRSQERARCHCRHLGSWFYDWWSGSQLKPCAFKRTGALA